MQRKNFKDYLENRLHKDEIAQIEKLALREKQILDSLKISVAYALNHYMQKHAMDIPTLAEHAHISINRIKQIQKCQANLTLASIAHIFAHLDQEPQLTFKK